MFEGVGPMDHRKLLLLGWLGESNQRENDKIIIKLDDGTNESANGLGEFCI